MHACEEYRELISLALDNEISREDMAQLQQHLDECHECRMVYDAFMSISDAVSGSAAEPPQELAAGVMFRVNAIAHGKRRRRTGWIKFAAAAACFVIIAVAAADIGFDRHKSVGDAEAAADAVMDIAKTDAEAPADTYNFSDNDAQEWDAPAAQAPAAFEPAPQEPIADTPLADTPAADAPAADEPAAAAPDSEEPQPDEPTFGGKTASESEEEVSRAASASLMNITEAVFYSGAPSDFSDISPSVIATGEDAIEALAKLLSFSELVDGEQPVEEPLFTIIAESRDGEPFDISVWITDNRLIVKLGSTGTLYIADGSFSELLAFIDSVLE